MKQTQILAGLFAVIILFAFSAMAFAQAKPDAPTMPRASTGKKDRSSKGGQLRGVDRADQVARAVHDPLTPEEHVTLGLNYETKGRPELAAREYHAALRQEHGYVPAMVGLGNLAFERGALEEAEAYYQQALAVAPKDPGANNNLAMLYLSRGARLDEAERLARQALEQDGPLRPYALDTLARVYARQRRYQEAKAALEEAEAMAPLENTVIHERLAQLREQLEGVN